MSTSPSPSSCTSASRTGVRELPKRFASDSVRSRSPGPNSPERIASRSSSETRSELVGLGVIGEAALKECIQNHAAPPESKRNRPHFAFNARNERGLTRNVRGLTPQRADLTPALRPDPGRCGRASRRRRRPQRASAWYSGFGSIPVACAMRFVKLNIDAISITSQRSSSLRPCSRSASRSASSSSAGAIVSTRA